MHTRDWTDSIVVTEIGIKNIEDSQQMLSDSKEEVAGPDQSYEEHV